SDPAMPQAEALSYLLRGQGLDSNQSDSAAMTSMLIGLGVAQRYDSSFITGERTSEGFYRTHAGIEQAISRGLAYAPYADLVWCE
ncbi:hypothetical protein MJN85_29100, partial [Salmonella enterica subsp. enterica serovar Anatum]|nr:hypothetical protein [Salmonella enterica subsp. enterica serovar Anatum]